MHKNNRSRDSSQGQTKKSEHRTLEPQRSYVLEAGGDGKERNVLGTRTIVN